LDITPTRDVCDHSSGRKRRLTSERFSLTPQRRRRSGPVITVKWGMPPSLEQFQLNPVHTLRLRNNRRNRLAKSYRLQRQWPAIVQVLFERRPFAMQPSILKTPSRLD
jgi:hypothetical protein